MLIPLPTTPAFIPPTIPLAANSIVPFVLPAAGAAAAAASAVTAPLAGSLLLTVGIGLVVGGLLGYNFDQWGMLNSSPKQTQSIENPLYAGYISGTLPPPGNTIGGTLTVTLTTGNYDFYQFSKEYTPAPCTGLQNTPFFGSVRTFFDVIKAEIVFGYISGTSPSNTCGPTLVQLEYYRADSPTQKRTSVYVAGGTGVINWRVPINFSWNHPSAIPYQGPVETLPSPDGFFVPEVIPKPLALPSLLPALPSPRPITTPEPLTEEEPQEVPPIPGAPPTTVPREPSIRPEPSVVPITPGTPAPQTPRIEPPKVPLVPQQPAETGTEVKIGPDANVIPAEPAPVPQTPTNTKTFGPVTITSNPPQPNLVDIAKELGFIESKLEKLLDPGPVPQIPWLDLLSQLLQALLNASDSGSYQMTGVCEVDEENNLLDPQPEYEYEWGGSIFAIANVASRLDAIAEMLQTHKELRQPTCVRPKPQGQPVQVNFIQSELEWEPPP